jgi:hypothetical protein
LTSHYVSDGRFLPYLGHTRSGKVGVAVHHPGKDGLVVRGEEPVPVTGERIGGKFPRDVGELVVTWRYVRGAAKIRTEAAISGSWSEFLLLG